MVEIGTAAKDHVSFTRMNHRLTDASKKGDVLRLAIQLRNEGRLYIRGNRELEDLFKGSIDRFCEIAIRLNKAKRVLDVGAGQGLLLSFLAELGHDCHALDVVDQPSVYPDTYGKGITFQVCNVEADVIPYPDESFDAVVCCQVLEHFSHSHLPAVREMRRVLRSGGVLEIDVPNVASLRNRSRLVRGKHITYDYADHYLHATPILYKGRSYYPRRHNREFTKGELELLLREAGFQRCEVSFLKSRRYREGIERLRSVGTAIKDAIPSFRKSLIAFAYK
ncbi:MAG TPA: class I SAM-dependent methyltransferase [Nitrospira sp.]|jgi:ubiquinone/menaquinone biosynthesis C-methylase UbiE|nr:class I SAM-dependent methyltransferase [Nitrospira sp.]